MKKIWLLALLGFLGCRHYPLHAQVPVAPYRTPRVTFTTQTGQPLSGGCVFTYQGGTTTPAATYTDYTGNTANANPVILDSTGSAVIWLAANTYKYRVYSSGGVNCASGSLQYTVDQVPGDEWINGTISGATITGAAIVSSTIDSTPIGATTPAPVNGSYFNGPIGTGGGTPAAGNFTSLASAIQNVSFSGTPTFNASAYGNFYMTLSGNVTSSTITGGLAGERVNFTICQNGTGGYTFAWPVPLQNPPINPPVVNPIPGSCTFVSALNNGSVWNVTGSSTFLPAGNYDPITFSATPVFPASSYSNFVMVLSGNVTSSTITGGADGQIIGITLCQGVAGGYTVVWPTTLGNPPTVDAAPNSCTSLTAIFNGPAVVPEWQVIGSNSVASPAYAQVQVLAPIVPASATMTMQGMAASITPTSTGRVHVQYSANVACPGLTAPGDGVVYDFYYGTGSAPANGNAVSGTLVTLGGYAVTSSYIITATVTSGAVYAPLSRDFIVDGLTLNTPYWFDASAEYLANMGCGSQNAMITLQEF